MADPAVDYNKNIVDLYNSNERYRSALIKSIQAVEAQEKAHKKILGINIKVSEEYKNATKNLNEYIKKMVEIKLAQEKYAQIQEKVEKAVEKQTKGMWRHISAGSKSIGIGRQIISTAASYTAVLGAQSITFKNVVDSVLKYNQSMFNLSRSQKLFGSDNSNISASLEKFTKTTSFSKNQLLDFTNTMSGAYLGVKPANEEMMNMAKMLQDRFGPNLEVVKEKMMSLMNVQNQFPSLYGEIERAMKTAEKAQKGDIDSKKQLEIVSISIISKMKAMGKSASEIEDVMRSVYKPTEDQKKGIDLNRQVANVAKESENALTNMGIEGEKGIILAAQATEKLVSLINEVPKAAMIAAASMTAIGAALDIGLGKAALSAILKKRAAKIMGAGNASGAGGIMGAEGGFGASEPRHEMEKRLFGRGGGPAASGGRGIGSLASKMSKFRIPGLAGFGSRSAVGALGSFGAIAGAGLAGYGAGKFIDEKIGASDFFGRIMASKKTGGFESQSGLKLKDSKKQEEFEKRFKERGGDKEKDISKQHEIRLKILKEMRDEQSKIISSKDIELGQSVKLELQLSANLQDQKAQLDIANQMTEALGQQVEITQYYGTVDKQLLDARTKSLDDQMVFAQNYLKLIEQINKDELKNLVKPGTDLGDIGKQKKAISDALKEGKFAGEGDKEAKSRLDALYMKQKEITQQEALRGQIKQRRDDSGLSAIQAELKQQEEISSLYEERLNVERQLMESAQFGMGASVEMMQKQVDLAYEFMKTMEKADRDHQKALEDKGIGKERIEAVKNAKTQAEAQQKITQWYAKGTDEYDQLNKYASEHQKYSTKIMQQQQKIYDLTKEVREGYLDAIREMSIGAGEFEKIIGTQEMGTSQLLDTIEAVTGESKGNSMKMGGKQKSGSMVGTEVTGYYSTQGMHMAGGEKWNEMSGRLYKQDEAKKKAEDAISGKAAAEPPKAGTGLVEESLLNPARESKEQGVIIGEAAGDKIAEAIKNPMKNIEAAGVKGRSDYKDAQKTKADAVSSGKLVGEYVKRSADAVARASGGTVNVKDEKHLTVPDRKKENDSLKEISVHVKKNAEIAKKTHEEIKKTNVQLKGLNAEIKSMTGIKGGIKDMGDSGNKEKRVKRIEDMAANIKKMVGAGPIKQMNKPGGVTSEEGGLTSKSKESSWMAEYKAKYEANQKAQADAAKEKRRQMAEVRAKEYEAKSKEWEADAAKASKMLGPNSVDAKRFAEISKEYSDKAKYEREIANKDAPTNQAKEEKMAKEEKKKSDVAAAGPKSTEKAIARAQELSGSSDGQSAEVVVKLQLSPEIIAEVMKSKGARIQLENAAKIAV